MNAMFQGCSPLTSLDGLSSRDVSKVSGVACMAQMFEGCKSLASADALANWDIRGALSSSQGVARLFGDTLVALKSLAVGPNFKLDSTMGPTELHSQITWWPVRGSETGLTTNELWQQSQQTDVYGTRWVPAASYPYQTDVVPTITWDSKVVSYTGYNQKILPSSVEVNGVALQPGIDYSVMYTKQGEGKAFPVVNSLGSYTARVYLQGKYVAKDNPSAEETVMVGDASGWVWEDTGWRYHTKDGSYLTGGWQWVADDVYGAHWYYFFEDGFCAMRNWIWDGAWYYIQGDCIMACGTWDWIDGAWYGFNWECSMSTAWIWDNSYAVWYYCYNSGDMARNAWIHGNYVNNTGRWIR